MIQSNLELESTKSVISGSLLKAYISFVAAKEILVLAEENYKISEENMYSMMEVFKAGKCISLELMQAQQTFEKAQIQLIDATFDAKDYRLLT